MNTFIQSLCVIAYRLKLVQFMTAGAYRFSRRSGVYFGFSSLRNFTRN